MFRILRTFRWLFFFSNSLLFVGSVLVDLLTPRILVSGNKSNMRECFARAGFLLQQASGYRSSLSGSGEEQYSGRW